MPICNKCKRILIYDPSSGMMLPEYVKDYGHMCIVDREFCTYTATVPDKCQRKPIEGERELLELCHRK